MFFALIESPPRLLPESQLQPRRVQVASSIGTSVCLHAACIPEVCCVHGTAAKLLKAREAELPGTVVLLFQPAEEGPGGAAVMISKPHCSRILPGYAAYALMSIPFIAICGIQDPAPIHESHPQRDVLSSDAALAACRGGRLGWRHRRARAARVADCPSRRDHLEGTGLRCWPSDHTMHDART